MPKDIVDYCVKNSIKIIAYTYNEPTIFFEYAYDTAKLAHEKGIKNVFVSNGYLAKEAIKKIEPYLDAINIDLKAFTDNFYKKICGAKLKPVLDGIKIVNDSDIWMEITTLLIPGENDSPKELKELTKFLVDVNPNIPWHISRFYPNYKMQDKQATSMETLETAYKIGKKAGLNYVYIGNIISQHENTYCTQCNHLLIERSEYAIKTNYTKAGECPDCKTSFPLIN